MRSHNISEFVMESPQHGLEAMIPSLNIQSTSKIRSQGFKTLLFEVLETHKIFALMDVPGNASQIS